MTLLAILMDALMVGLYMWQASAGAGTYMIGFILQIIAVIALLWATFGYQGKKYKNPWIFGWFTASIGYGIIIMSLVVGALILFLYGLNVFGINSIIFSR